MTEDTKNKIMLLANEYSFWSECYAILAPSSDAARRALSNRSLAKLELENYLDYLITSGKAD